jgi:hypothetical protein
MLPGGKALRGDRIAEGAAGAPAHRLQPQVGEFAALAHQRPARLTAWRVSARGWRPASQAFDEARHTYVLLDCLVLLGESLGRPEPGAEAVPV